MNKNTYLVCLSSLLMVLSAPTWANGGMSIGWGNVYLTGIPAMNWGNFALFGSSAASREQDVLQAANAARLALAQRHELEQSKLTCQARIAESYMSGRPPYCQ